MAGARPEYFPSIITAMDCFVGESGPGQMGEYFFHTLGSSGAFNLVILMNGPLASGVPGYTVLFGIMMVNAHVSKKITGATLTKAGRV